MENDIYNIRTFLFATPTTVPTIITPAAVVAFAVDPINQHLYWSDHSGSWPNGVMRANYDGSTPTGVLGSPIYYRDTVRRANLDGTNIEPLLSGADVESAEAALYVCAP